MCRREGKTRIHVNDAGYNSMDWIEVARHRDRWPAVGKTIIPSGSKHGEEFLVYLTGREINDRQVYSQWTGIVIIVFIIIILESRIIIGMLIVSKVIKFSAFCGNRQFIAAFTGARHLSLSSRLFQSALSQPLTLRSILALSSHLRFDPSVTNIIIVVVIIGVITRDIFVFCARFTPYIFPNVYECSFG